MSRNLEFGFELAPHETMRRSKFDLSHSLKTSFNVGDIIPNFCQEILPGDTFSVKTSKVVRLQTLLDPIMDDLFLDQYYFFVPNRLVWEHWKEFMGENTSAPWTQTTTYTIPQLTAPSGGWSVGTIADFLGVPTGVSGISVNALPFRAVAMVMNEWFRNENTTNPVDFTIDDTTVTGTNGTNQVTDIYKGGYPFKASKYPDYFTKALPSPQKGNDTMLPLGDFAPVVTLSNSVPVANFKKDSYGNLTPMRFSSNILNNGALQDLQSGSLVSISGGLYADNSSPSATAAGVPNNLFTDMKNVTGTSVNQLRLAFQIQKLAELDARSGTRYIEKIKAHFGVTSPDARMQRPEYLGGNRIKLNVKQVTQTSATGATGTPQGHQSAYSATADSHGDFSKSFTEHGYLLGFACVRYHHTYQQGLHKMFSRQTINDFYWPILANIGETAIKNKEIYCDGSATDDGVFGYQEAWAEYRYVPNRTAGEMRSQATNSLDSWHLGDDYSSCPSLSSSWIQEDKTTVDRVLAVTSSVSNQLFGDFWFDVKATRVMPTFSIPGLIDHH